LNGKGDDNDDLRDDAIAYIFTDNLSCCK
jgi:hypothetical protein